MDQRVHNDIAAYLLPGKTVHLVGIGGVSMRPLGIILRDMGMTITGSDMNSSVSTEELVSRGIPVYIGHSGDNLGNADCVIRTAAARNDNPEIAAARERGIPVFERAQAWGHIMRAYDNAICISGTHGKTTTTAMVTHIFFEAQRDPTVMIGGHLPLLGAGHHVGRGRDIIAESCEYCNSFHNFFPTVAVILNVEADHLDFFKDLADVQASFRHFARLVPQTGTVIASADDENTRQALEGIPQLTFGLGESAQVRGINCSDDFRELDVTVDGTLYCHLSLSVVGRHNAMNALAACAVAYVSGIDGQTAARGLAGFTGAGRRMERKGSYKGAMLYDDYAHHPSELHALLTAAKALGGRRIVCAFQPHTYTRTHALFEDFVRELQAADVLILAEIYAAREQNTVGISSRDLAQQLPGSRYCATLQEVTQALADLARPGDLLLTVGAGDIYKAGEALLRTQTDH